MRSGVRVFVALAIVAALVLVTGCAGESTQLPANQLLLRASDTRVDFTRVFGFPWDRVYVFAPYSTSDTVNSALGFKWPGYDRSIIGASDSVNLVVFVKDSKVTGWFEQARSVDLGEIATREGYARNDAVFSVETTESGLTLRR